MKILKDWKKDKLKVFNKVILIVIIIYTLFFNFYIFSISAYIQDTLKSITMPNGYYFHNFTTPEPHFEISIGLSNNGLYKINEFSIDISLDLCYLNQLNNHTINNNLFRKTEFIGMIREFVEINYTIEISSDYFNNTLLDDFWNNLLYYSNIQYLMNTKIAGRLYFNLIPFSINLYNIDLLLLISSNNVG